MRAKTGVPVAIAAVLIWIALALGFWAAAIFCVVKVVMFAIN